MQRTAWWTAAAAIVALAVGTASAKAPEGGRAPNVGGSNAPHVDGNAAPERGTVNPPSAVEPGTTKLLDPARVPNTNTPGLDRRDNRMDRREDRREDRRFSDNGRFHWYGDRWWYWLPDNRWMYYDNNAWQDYYEPNQTTYQTYDDRYEFYNGQWFYAMPSGQWDVYADGRWTVYNGNEAPQRRISGYRGLPEEGRHEENGARPEDRSRLNPEAPDLTNGQRHIEHNAPNQGNIRNNTPNVPNTGNAPNVPNPGNARPNVPNPGSVPNIPAPVNPGGNLAPGGAPSVPSPGGPGGGRK